MQDLVVVVNLNGSACRMMAQKLRAEHFYCRIVSSACAAEDIQRMGARGIVLAAGVSGEAADVPFLMDYLQTGLPMLCVGDSALSLCQTLGGELSEPVPQDGAMQIHLDASDALLDGMEDTDRYQPTARLCRWTARRRRRLPQQTAGCSASTPAAATCGASPSNWSGTTPFRVICSSASARTSAAARRGGRIRR